jgi:hypothetical protein
MLHGRNEFSRDVILGNVTVNVFVCDIFILENVKSVEVIAMRFLNLKAEYITLICK